MDGIQAAVLQVKLQRLDHGNQRRRARPAIRSRIQGIEEVVTPFEAGYGKQVYHLYPIRVQERDELMRRLESRELGAASTTPFRSSSEGLSGAWICRGAFPISERTSAEFISLPMFPELSGTQIELVIGAVKESLAAGVPCERAAPQRRENWDEGGFGLSSADAGNRYAWIASVVS
jgi:dTDP-4-amino-4,6-dideoxygalactose transaminase